MLAEIKKEMGARIELMDIKRHGGWKSNTVAEEYIEMSKDNKKKVATKILGEIMTSSSCSNITTNRE